MVTRLEEESLIYPFCAENVAGGSNRQENLAALLRVCVENEEVAIKTDIYTDYCMLRKGMPDCSEAITDEEIWKEGGPKR